MNSIKYFAPTWIELQHFAGTCIRLYTKSFFDKYLDEFDPSEMQTAPLEKLYVNVKHLSMKLPVREDSGWIAASIVLTSNKLDDFSRDRSPIRFTSPKQFGKNGEKGGFGPLDDCNQILAGRDLSHRHSSAHLS